MASPRYDPVRYLPHHDGSVYWMAHFLGVRRRLGQLVRGALLHDFFHYDWHAQRPRSGGLHGFEHPREALENAERDFGPLTKVERDCILRHMWPLTPVPPRFTESMIVCTADKIVSLLEMYRTLRAGRGLGVL